MKKSNNCAWGNIVTHRENRVSTVFFDVFFPLLTLVTALAMIITSAVFADNFAYAESVSGSAVRTAAIDQLSDAPDNDGISNIYDEDEEAIDEAEEEETEEEETEEEVPVAAAPEKTLKSAGTPAAQLRNNGTPENGTNGVWYVDSWQMLRDVLEKNDQSKVNTIIITKDIVASPAEGYQDKTALLRGKTVTVRGPADKTVYIYRDAKDADFPLFTVQNDNNTLKLGDNLVLSGKTAKCARTLSEFASDDLPGNAKPEEHQSEGTTTVRFYSSYGYLGNGYESREKNLELNSNELVFDIDSNGKLTANINGKHWVRNFQFRNTPDPDGKDVEVHDSNGNKVTSVVDGESYILYDPSWGSYIGYEAQSGKINKGFSLTNALRFTASAVGGFDKYWTVPGQTTPKYTSATDEDLLAAMDAYNAAHPVSGWIIDGEPYYDESSASNALAAYNQANDLPAQGCVPSDKTWTSSDFAGGSSINDPKAFFVLVQNQGTLDVDGTIFEEFNTDASIKNAAPVVVIGNSGDKKTTFSMSRGQIRKNTVGYGADENDSQATAQRLKDELVTNSNRTDTAGAVIITGSRAAAYLSGTATIGENRADAGAFIVTNDASVVMDMNKATGENPIGINGNIGWHHGGAILVENGGTFHLKNGSINNNVAWLKGGAVWATEYGTSGLVEWDKYPNTMKPVNDNHYEKGGCFVMDGGELDGNFAFVRAGAVEVESNGVQLNNGRISNNMCKSLGGAIYVEGDSPIYTYTLNIRNGYIHHNTAVDSEKDDDLDKKLVNGKLTKGDAYANGSRHSDGDWSYWGMKQSGDGGGVWLCSMGGTSVFTSNNKTGDEKAQVVIHSNTASKKYDTAADNGWGNDFYISRRYGSALVQNLPGEWIDDAGNLVGTIDANGKIIKGPKGMENTDKTAAGTGIEIYGNRSRNGGGIAANGTIILGEASDVYRYEAELNITKGWDPDLTQEEVTIRFYYHVDADNDGRVDDGELFPLKNEARLDANSNADDESEFFEIKLGGDNTADTITGNEVIYRTGKNEAKAFIPATVKHTDGSTVHLYKIKNKQGSKFILDDHSITHIDTNNEKHLEKLFAFLSTEGNLNVPIDIDADWNIVIKEEPADKYTFVQNPLDQPKATAKVTNSVQLVNPDNGSNIPEGSFSINLNTVTFGQTLSNSPKATDFEIEKADNDDKAIRRTAEFKLFEVKDAEANAEHWKIADVTKGSTFTVDAETGKLRLENLKYEHAYLLFETKAPKGYKRAVKPWLVKADAAGNVTVWRERSDRGHYDRSELKEVNEFPADYSYLNDPELSTYEWPKGWFASQDAARVTKLANEPEPALVKADENGVAVTGSSAQFVITKADTDSNGWFIVEGRNWKGHTLTNASAQAFTGDPEGAAKIVSSDPSTGRLSINDLPAGNYLLFETAAPNGFRRATAPWLIQITHTGTGLARNVYALRSEYADKAIVGENDPKLQVIAESDQSAYKRWWPDNWFDKIQSTQNLVNEPKYLTKVDLDGAEGDTPTVLSGATFKLYSVHQDKASGVEYYCKGVDWANALQKDKREYDLSTDADGRIQLPGEVTTSEGKYLLFEETSPLAYRKATKPWLVEVAADGTITVKSIEDSVTTGDGSSTINNTKWWKIDDFKERSWSTLNRVPNELDTVTRKARKVWVDKNGNTTTPPNNVRKVTVHLYKIIDGERTLVETKEINSSNWSATVVFDNLPKFRIVENITEEITYEEEISYEIVEEPVEGYVPSYDVNGDTTTVTNKPFNGGTVKLNIDKSWTSLNGEPESIKPSSIMVDIYCDLNEENKPVLYRENVEILASEEWKKTVSELPLFANDGRKLKYWVKEQSVEGFAPVEVYSEATENQPTHEQTALYTGHTQKIGFPSSVYQRIAGHKYRIDKQDGNQEIVYCMNTNYTAPPGAQQDGTQYRRVLITLENASLLSNYMQNESFTYTVSGYTGTYTAYPTYSIGKDKGYEKLYYTLLKLAYYGYGGQDNSWVKTANISDDILNHLTQYAVYEYTDYYFNQYKEKKSTYTSGQEIYGPYGLVRTKGNNDTEGWNYHIYSKNAYQKDYLALLGKIEDTSDQFIKDIGLKLYIYVPNKQKPDGQKKYQNLLGVETSEVNMYASIKNQVKYEEITLYKYGVTAYTGDAERTGLNGVKFTLYEPATAANGGTTVEGIGEPVKVRQDNITTGGAGTVTISGLMPGRTYYLKEKTAANGYLRTTKAIRFRLSNKANGTTEPVATFDWNESMENADQEIVLSYGAGVAAELKVANKKIYDLPSAGGMGTYWFMVIGAMLMGFAVTAAFTRMNIRKIFRR